MDIKRQEFQLNHFLIETDTFEWTRYDDENDVNTVNKHSLHFIIYILSIDRDRSIHSDTI